MRPSICYRACKKWHDSKARHKKNNVWIDIFRLFDFSSNTNQIWKKSCWMESIKDFIIKKKIMKIFLKNN